MKQPSPFSILLLHFRFVGLIQGVTVSRGIILSLTLTLRSSTRSLIVGRSELAGTAVAAHNPALVLVLLDQAGADELPHETGSIVADLVVVLQLGDSLLHGVELSHLGSSIGLLFCLSLLVSLDLRQGPSSLAGDLQHIG